MKQLAPAARALFPQNADVYVAFCSALIIAILYTLYVGPTAVWLDSLHYATRARHLLELGDFAQSAAYPSTPPLYSLLMSVGFVFPDIESGHRVLIILQALLMSSALFPLRALLLRATELQPAQGTVIALGTLLLPCFISYAPLLTPETMALPLLVYGVFFLDRILGGSREKADGIGAGLCLGAAWLTLYSAGILWLAALTALVPLLQTKQKKVALLAMLLPLAFFVPWLALNFGKDGFDLQLSMNNALARFNFGKNALLYIMYGGAPLAGIALILSGLLKGKSFWNNGFFRFAFVAVIGISVIAALTNNVIVDKKLDYFTNRVIEPYLFLPLIALFRLDPQWRKDLLANSLLVFFVFLIFGMPMGLHLDFQSGLAFWNGAGNASSAAGIIRNVLYMVMVAIPVGMLFWRARWFVTTYTFMLFIMAAIGMSSTAYIGTHNDEAKITNAEVGRLYNNEVFPKLDNVYVEYRCKGQENNDVAYLFGCFDLGRTLYFLPKLPVNISADELLKLPREKVSNAVFASTETDNSFGPVIAQKGIARFQELKPQSLSNAARAPLVQVEKIKGMKFYIGQPLVDRIRRITLLEPETEITFKAAEAGCVRVEADWYMEVRARTLSVQLNDGAVNKLTVPLIDKGQKPPLGFKLNLPKGESVLHVRYEPLDKDYPEASLVMFERPVIKPCGGFDGR
jgi:hypothetical protein